MSGYIDARTQAAAILTTEAQRLAAFVPPPCAPNDSMRKWAAASGAIMRMDEVAFLTALAEEAAMREVNYEDLELCALAHMAYQCGPRMKSVFVDRDAMREMSRRHAVYHGHEWDPAPPLRMGPQRCLSSRETIERLAFVPKEPALTPKDAGALLSAWWSKYPAAREYFPEHPKATRHVWMGGDYIDDGTYKATPEDAAERWREVREALVSIEREDGAVAYMNPAYPTHTRDSGPRG